MEVQAPVVEAPPPPAPPPEAAPPPLVFEPPEYLPPPAGLAPDPEVLALMPARMVDRLLHGPEQLTARDPYDVLLARMRSQRIFCAAP